MSSYRRLKFGGQFYFFTVVTFARRPVFVGLETVGLLRAVIDEVRERHPFSIDAEVILPDHIHAIWRLPDEDADYSVRWMLIKSSFTRRLLKHSRSDEERSPRQLAKREQTIWQRRFWEHLIRNDGDYNRHVDYIRWNPVRHGLVARPEDWPHSTYSRIGGAVEDLDKLEPTWRNMTFGE